MKLDGGSNLVNIASGKALSTTDVYTNEYRPRSTNTDTIWYGLLSSGTGSAEIFRYDYSAEALDFNTIIDNTGRSVIGNIIDTTVSGERLKTDIKEIKTNCISCVKKVKPKTFPYNDEKYSRNDKFGFIAQGLLKALPEEFKDIVKENKEKNSDETYLSINYMKMAVVLWKCNQDMIGKIEKLEKEVKELKK